MFIVFSEKLFILIFIKKKLYLKKKKKLNITNKYSVNFLDSLIACVVICSKNV